jgi:hypothetical protein
VSTNLPIGAVNHRWGRFCTGWNGLGNLGREYAQSSQGSKPDTSQAFLRHRARQTCCTTLSRVLWRASATTQTDTLSRRCGGHLLLYQQAVTTVMARTMITDTCKLRTVNGARDSLETETGTLGHNVRTILAHAMCY